MTPIKVNIKPLSVNDAWKGKRFKTKEYSIYQKNLLLILPSKIDLPEPPYQIYLKFGFSSAHSDWDNPIKPTQDVLAAKYGFNDKLIKKGIVEVESVKKGEEFFEFSINKI